MARRRAKNYKQIHVETKDVGSAGGQILLGYFDPLDVEGGNVSAWLNNVNLSVLLNNSPEGEIGGFLAYLTTGGTWNESDIITARAGNFADTVHLTAKRVIRAAGYQADRNDARIALWIEITDITLGVNVDLRIVVETWGRFIKYHG